MKENFIYFFLLYIKKKKKYMKYTSLMQKKNSNYKIKIIIIIFIVLLMMKQIWSLPIISGNRLGSPISSAYLGQSVFDYIEKMMARSTVFMNFLYVAEQNKGSEVCVFFIFNLLVI